MSGLKRILTPEEAMALQKPAVQEHVEQINRALARGERYHVLQNALVDDVVIAVRASGWMVSVEPFSKHIESHVSVLRFAEPEPRDDEAAERAGAEVLAAARVEGSSS